MLLTNPRLQRLLRIPPRRLPPMRHRQRLSSSCNTELVPAARVLSPFFSLRMNWPAHRSHCCHGNSVSGCRNILPTSNASAHVNSVACIMKTWLVSCESWCVFVCALQCIRMSSQTYCITAALAQTMPLLTNSLYLNIYPPKCLPLFNFRSTEAWIKAFQFAAFFVYMLSKFSFYYWWWWLGWFDLWMALINSIPNFSISARTFGEIWRRGSFRINNAIQKM